ncbi:MAG: RNA-binding protein [Nitrospirota bacterium]
MQGSKLYVGNLSYSTTREQIEELFASFGTVNQVNIIEGKGFGFVEMSSTEEAEKAKDGLDGTDFSGRNIRVSEARPPKSRDSRERGGPPPRGRGERGGGGGFRKRF